MDAQEQHHNQVRPSRADYQARRRQQSVVLYFRSAEELAEHRLAAAASGYEHNFNAWLLQMIRNATSGSVFPPEYVEAIKRDLEKARSWLETAREENQDYRAQVKVMQAQRDTLLTLLHGLPDGAEVAARFLEQVAPAQGVRA
jgi:hypothetical protein